MNPCDLKEFEENTEKSLPERVFDEIPTDRHSAITSGEIRRRLDEPTFSQISPILYRFYGNHRVKREKIGNIFVYWRGIDEKEDERDKTNIREKLTATEFILTALPWDQEHALSVKDLTLDSYGKFTYNTLNTRVHELRDKELIKRVWNGQAFCYWDDKSKWKGFV